MKIETILKSMERSHLRTILVAKQPQRMRRYRQFYAFRARILKVFEEKDAEIEYWRGKYIRLIQHLEEPDED